MQENVDAGERLVCAVLAAQVASIRDRADAGTAIDLLWRTGDVLARLSSLVLELARRCPSGDPRLDEECSSAVAEEAEVSVALDALAFVQAQRHDLARQMADCVVTVLARLAADDRGVRVSPGDLVALYVSDDQRRTHDTVTRRFGIAPTVGEPPPGAGIFQGPVR